MDIFFNDKSPIYLQIIDYIKMDIVTGKLQGDAKLPSVREMSATLKVNPNTLQRAYQELERMGIVYTQRGMGTFVSEDNNMVENLKNEMAKEIIDSFMLRMKSLGFTEPQIIKIISKEVMEVKNNE
ncbi:MAG: GntR family transcriptional regulator [Clostridiaceae bacterium]|nr:GntR family transcriptional regulator [Clostridiaceae bacterium]